MKYANGYFSESIIPDERTLIIVLTNNGTKALEEHLDTILSTYSRYMNCVCFISDSDADQHDLVPICRKLHSSGKKIIYDTSLDEESKINRRLLDELDYVRLSHTWLRKKDYSPFGDFEDWVDV